MGTPECPRTPQRVVTCYDFFDIMFPEAGLHDFTDGIYDGDPETNYEVAQRRQHDYLLDELGCQRGSRILELGCGNGTLLEAVRARGATGVGITISPPQLQRCREKGLDVRLLNYRDMGRLWEGHFDGVVANGSAEHFVQAEDAARGSADAIYRELFALCRKVINPASPSGRFVTTIIHFGRFTADPAHALRSPYRFRPGSDNFHFSLLVRSFGGFYPGVGQLEHCARPHFQLVREVDGTHDYHLTSEAWVRRVKQALRDLRRAPRLWGRFLPFLARHPRQATTMVICLLLANSWSWQFRSDNPPMRLLRQTWQRQS